MPMYPFRCPECGNTFEVEQKMPEKHEASCPECDSVAERVYTPTPDIWKCGCHKVDYPSRIRSKK